MLEYKRRGDGGVNRGTSDYHRHQQFQGIKGDMSFSATDLLATVIASFPLVSVVLTVWESKLAALGSASSLGASITTLPPRELTLDPPGFSRLLALLANPSPGGVVGTTGVTVQ